MRTKMTTNITAIFIQLQSHIHTLPSSSIPSSQPQKTPLIFLEPNPSTLLKINIEFSQIFQLVLIIKMDSSKMAKATSYRDLIKNFQQAQHCITNRDKRATPRQLQLKKTTNQNKQNQFSKNHAQSIMEKNASHHVSEWVEEDVLKEYNHKRKDRQLQLSYHRFISYITNVMSNITGQVPPELLTLKLTYLQFLASLKETAFIKDTYEPTPTDVVTELWNELVANGQTVGIFIIFASVILNMKKSDEDGTQKYSYMWKKYSELRYTRMETLGKMKTSNDEQEFPFTPMISKRSRTLAASRSRSKNCKDKCLVQKSYHQLLEESQDSQNNCSSSKEIMMVDSKAGNKRSDILYKLAKEKSLQKRRDKKSSEVEYEKSIKQLTFHPKIHPSVKEKPKMKTIQGEQDSIDRMIRGRIEREVRKVINEKGLPYNQKMFQKMKKQKYEKLMKANKHLSVIDEVSMDSFAFQSKQQHIPQQKSSVQTREKSNGPLVLSVQVDEGRIEKLIIKEGECYKQAAAKFIQDMKLGPELYEKLIAGVENALRCQLTQIDEDSFESEFQSTC